jgi:GT2 family glycosyltransferase
MNSVATQPNLSVIIPVYNCAAELRLCLDALENSSLQSYEVIVVDDGSTDDSVVVARGRCEKLLTLASNGGPSAARNCGAESARASILFFLDSDVLVEPSTLERVLGVMTGSDSLQAMFCSYQPDTVPKNFVSQYKNLQHHYTHQISKPVAHTFCGGYGAIRADVFRNVGGFDEGLRAMEDVDLGYRLHQLGHKIELHCEIQLTHLKRYDLVSLIRSDVKMRAIPWTQIMLARRVFQSDLNLQPRNILSAPLSVLFCMSMLAAPIWPGNLFVAGILLVAIVALNRGFLGFVLRQRGWVFALKSLLMTLLFYVYSVVGAGWGLLSYLMQTRQRKAV